MPAHELAPGSSEQIAARFPKLDASQIAGLARFGQQRDAQALWRRTRPVDKLARVPGSRTISVFPMGISGQELSNRAFVQAEKFGARIAIAQSAKGLTTSPPLYTVELDDGGSAWGRTVFLAAGS
jgi:thioredoxin reductase